MQKNIKRYISLALGICLLLLCVAACSQGDSRPIAIALSGGKTQFAYGEAFSEGALEVTVKMENGTTRRAEREEYTVDSTAYKASVAGFYEITVSLKDHGVSKSYTVAVSAIDPNATPVSIAVDPVKTKFKLGEQFTGDGLGVTVTMSDQTVRQVKSEDIVCDFSAYQANIAGTYPVTVSLKGYDLSASYEVTVAESVVSSWDEDGALKILTVGNSFSDDAMSYVWNIATDLGIKEVVLGNLFIGGCTLDTHANNALNNAPAYEYRLNTNGSWSTTVNYRMGTAIQSEDWDFISFQQASGSSGQVNTYARLQELIDYARAINDSARFVWHMTWAYQQNSNHGEFQKYNGSQQTMYEKILSSVQGAVVPCEDVEIIIPNGTAIQNARTSFVGDNLTRDGYHLSLELGRYVAGLTLVQSLTGLSVKDVEYTPVSSAHQKVAVESAVNACSSPFEVTPSRYATLADAEQEVELPSEDEYQLLEIDWTPFGFYNATDRTNYAKPITSNASLSPKFFATQRFTKQTLPVGSIVILSAGWRYRPEAWLGDAPLDGVRPSNVSVTRLVVTEQWWGNYAYRAFNLSKEDGSSLQEIEDEARGALKIYVPKK